MAARVESKPRVRLTRDRVIEAALAVMDRDGLDAVTMRRVGRDLGVEAMSLYNHVRDKEDLLDGIREYVLSQFLDPGTEGPWEERARRAARSWRQVLREHPSMVALISESKGPNITPGSIRPAEVALRLLRELGLSDEDAVKAFCAVGGYIVGFVLFEIGMMHTTDTGSPTAGQLAAAIPADECPCFVSSLPYLVQGDADERFEFGLDLLIEGLRTMAASTATAPA